MAESRVIIFDKGRRPVVNDTELVAALRAHDERAYTLAWIELGPMVRRLVTRFFGVGADTPDLSQEVFLRLFRRIDELRNPSGLRGFVVGICLGVARNELRRARVRRWVRLTPHGELPEAPAPGTDMEARAALRRLYAILDLVSAQDRSLFVARFFEKMEIAEIAVAHALSYGTAKRHVARAVARINRRIERDPLLAKYLDQAGGDGSGGRDSEDEDSADGQVLQAVQAVIEDIEDSEDGEAGADEGALGARRAKAALPPQPIAGGPGPSQGPELDEQRRDQPRLSGAKGRGSQGSKEKP